MLLLLLLLLAVPLAVLTDTKPVAAPGITMPTNLVPVLLTTIAFLPPIVKVIGVLRLVPVIVTNVPTLPVVGVKEVMVGDWAVKAVVTTNAMSVKSIAIKLLRNFIVFIRFCLGFLFERYDFL